MTDIETIVLQQPQNLPRYTSYPPANHFKAGEGLLLVKNLLTAARGVDALSIYIHIPYCDRLCWFCGCHTKQTLSYKPISDYVKALVGEIEGFGQRLGERKRISKIHLGGGSPSLLRANELSHIRKALELVGKISDATEVSLEVDPSDIKPHSISDFLAFGMTRASIGVQDFDPAVQQAINRPQSFGLTRDVVNCLRGAGVKSLNIDALYGLPLQTQERLQDSIAKVVSLSPDRIALFGYAHVPWVKPHQKMIKDADLPSQLDRFRGAKWAAKKIISEGYQSIGIDHFAKPEDSLAISTRSGKLKRNFQGYTDDVSDVIIGFGASSISQFPGGYVQNEVATGRYIAAVGQARQTGAKGLLLSEDDMVRAWIIERLMCSFTFSKLDLSIRFGVIAEQYWQEAIHAAAEDPDGLCEIRDEQFEIRTEARPLVRVVASKFDGWVNSTKFQYSQAI